MQSVITSADAAQAKALAKQIQEWPADVLTREQRNGFLKFSAREMVRPRSSRRREILRYHASKRNAFSSGGIGHRAKLGGD